MDEVEVTLVLEHELRGLAQVRVGIAAEAGRPQGWGTVGTCRPGILRVAAGKGRDLVAAPMELARTSSPTIRSVPP